MITLNHHVGAGGTDCEAYLCWFRTPFGVILPLF